MLRQLISYPKKIFRSLDLRSQISKRIMWIISKSHREKKFFFDIFAIHSSSRHEKCCQMNVRLFSLFRGSIYQQWQGIAFYGTRTTNLHFFPRPFFTFCYGYGLVSEIYRSSSSSLKNNKFLNVNTSFCFVKNRLAKIVKR